MSKSLLSRMGHAKTETEDMRYLVQPRGPGKSWVFRMVTATLTLTLTLTAIVNGHKKSRIDDLLPWNHAEKV